MTEGLVTRIGRWIDNKWKVKATEEMVLERWSNLENAQIRDKVELDEKIKQSISQLSGRLDVMVNAIKALDEAQTLAKDDKELADLKTRMEKMELYAGMTRKVDPTKPPVVKSAFQM